MNSKVRSNIINNIKPSDERRNPMRSLKLAWRNLKLCCFFVRCLCWLRFSLPFFSSFHFSPIEMRKALAARCWVYKVYCVYYIKSSIYGRRVEEWGETSWIHRRAPPGIRTQHTKHKIRLDSTRRVSVVRISKILSINSQEGMEEYLGIRSYRLRLKIFIPKISFFSRSSVEMISSWVPFKNMRVRVLEL